MLPRLVRHKLIKLIIQIPALILIAGLLLLSCAPAPESTPFTTPGAPVKESGPVKAPWEEKWETIVAKAKKEGELTVYTTLSGEVVRKVMAAFTERYGINGSVISARGPELMQRMETQRRAGLNIVDAVIAGGTNLVILMKPEGFLDRVDEVLVLPEVTDPAAWRTGGISFLDKEHYGIGMVASFVRHVIRNTELVKEGELTSYKDVLKPRWKGKMVMNDPAISGAGNSFVGILAQVWGVEETKDFLRQLTKQELTITRDNRQLVEWVSRGKYELGLGSQGEQVGEFLKMGAPVYPVKVVEGSKFDSMTGGIGIASKRPNPNAAALFVNWLLSKDGQAVFVKQAGLPGARVDAPKEGIPSIFFPEPDEKFFVATEESWRLNAEMIKVAAEIFGPLSK